MKLKITAVVLFLLLTGKAQATNTVAILDHASTPNQSIVAVLEGWFFWFFGDEDLDNATAVISDGD